MDTEQRRRHFSARIALLLFGAAALWATVTLPRELTFIKESTRVEALVSRVAVVPKRTVLTVTVPAAGRLSTHTVYASSFQRWEAGDRIPVLVHPEEVRVDSFFGRHPLSLPGIGGIGFLALVAAGAERSVARRRKEANGVV